MKIGMIGLGKMGGNMSRRLMKAGHSCVVFARSVQSRDELAKDGASAAVSVADLVKQLGAKPRVVWLMLPAGQATDETVKQLSGPPVKMDFRYDDWFSKESNVGYETLIYDVMIGDPTLFMRADMVDQTWPIVQPVLDAWAAREADVVIYPSGGSGPREADALLGQDGRHWRPVDGAEDGRSL